MVGGVRDAYSLTAMMAKSCRMLRGNRMYLFGIDKQIWRARRDSNPRPTGPQPVALFS